MPLDLASSLSVGHFVPWSFLFATALLATGVDAFARRAFNPVVLCVWFFGLAFCGAVGGWGVPELVAGMICLATPHMLICTFAGRARASHAREDQTPMEEEHHEPIPLQSAGEHGSGNEYRKVA
ncbi:MAG: hypothetical protein H6810_08575 [Phycisphaeraceae bacterium]|nr:MAG: hypothetical protein H6810_08575 [Phycisphaeraceae bacterium]